MRLKGYETQKARATRRREIARQEYERGASVNEIADTMKTTPRQVYRYLERTCLSISRYKKRDSAA